MTTKFQQHFNNFKSIIEPMREAMGVYKDLPKAEAKAEGEGNNKLRIKGVIYNGYESYVSEFLTRASGDIEIRISSPGGSAFAGMSIANEITDYDKGSVTTINDGLAASAASMIFQAGDERLMKTGSRLMIHDVAALAIGNEKVLREVANLVDELSADYAEMYAERGTLTANEYREYMKAETFFSAKDAVNIGLADGVVSSKKAKSEGQGSKARAVGAKHLISMIQYSTGNALKAVDAFKA